jgi:alkylglycerol monooxygenase
MSLDLIALAVPVFFLLIGLELAVARARRRRVYRFTDSFGDLGCGITQRAVLLLFEASLLAGYAWVHAHWRLWTFPEGSVWPWLVAIVGVDFAYYWWHRLSHEVNVLWAVHVVHHQSEDYNLAVALRQAVLSPVTVMPFYLPLAVLGVPVFVFFTVNALSTLYQFWIHTELIGKLGWFE